MPSASAGAKVLKKWVRAAIACLLMVLPFNALAQSPANNAERPGYLLVIGKATDREKLRSYASALPPIYASHNAYYLAIGGAGRGVTWLEGPWQDRSIIFAKFPSRGEVDAFWWGEPYREAIKKRSNAGAFSVVALQGMAPSPQEGPETGYLIVMTAPRDARPAQIAISNTAAQLFQRGVEASGGALLTSNIAGNFTAMEGDTVFDRFTIAAWPSLAARDAYLSSPLWRKASRVRQKLGLSSVASANGVPKTPSPP
jgi:uncharacterized protein (DUF1330 family)